MAEVRQAAQERLVALEEARGQTSARAERAEAQLDRALAELERLRTPAPSVVADDASVGS